METLRYTIEDYDTVRVINLNGNISNATKNELARMVHGLAAKGNVIINLKGVEMVTSSGINTLMKLSVDCRQKGKRLLLLGVKDGVRRMIDVLDYYDYFIVVDSVEEGQRKLAHYL
jgi:anti-anti-sigma factor